MYMTVRTDTITKIKNINTSKQDDRLNPNILNDQEQNYDIKLWTKEQRHNDARVPYGFTTGKQQSS